MYALRGIRTRKSATQCSLGHRAYRNRLITNARRDVLYNHPVRIGGVNSVSQNPIPDAQLINVSNEQDQLSQSEASISNHSYSDHEPENEGLNQNDIGNIPSGSESRHSIVDALDSVDTLEAHLANVYHVTNMNRTQLKGILLALRNHVCFSTIHIDPRTILGTPHFSLPTAKVAGGEYLHLGFVKGLISILESTPPQMIPRIYYKLILVQTRHLWIRLAELLCGRYKLKFTIFLTVLLKL